tara:strand:+ start:3919 stop:4335 length:417 start_codon:yes stop_codon:yes gene_type:complete
MSHKIKKHVKASWIKKSAPVVTIKPWGKEISWGGFSGAHGKILYILKDHSTSLKYHNLKSEVLFILDGKALVTYGDELSLTDKIDHPFSENILEAGGTLFVQSNCPYRISAIEDCKIIEIGDNMSDTPTRIEDKYGRT